MRRLGVPHPGEAAVFLRQLAFWLRTQSGYMSNGGTKKWIYNGYKEWVNSQFCSLSETQFGRMIRALIRLGFIEKTTFAHIKEYLDEKPPVSWHQGNTKSWLTLCVDKIEELTGWRPEYPLRNSEDSTKAADEASGDDIQEDVETTANQEQAPEVLPRNVLQNETSGSTDLKNPSCKSEEPSIYIENHLSNQNGGADKKERKEKHCHEEDGSHSSSSTTNDEKQASTKKPSPPVKKNHSGGGSRVRKKRNIESTNQDEHPVQEVWEIAPGQPFPVFLNWRANNHYKPQGGKWESDAYGNAYAEFYKNRQKTTYVLFPLFMQEVKGITERVYQAQCVDAVAANSLPSWFMESLPSPTLENVYQLMENLDTVIQGGVRVVLPNKAPTPSSLTVSYEEAQETAQLKPLVPVEAPTLPFNGERPPEGVEEVLKRKQMQWEKAPILRDRIRKWVEETPGVILTEDGPVLETSLMSQPAEAADVPANQAESPVTPDEPVHHQESANILDDPWDDPSPEESSPPDTHPEPTTETESPESAPHVPKAPLIKMMLAVWHNVSELGKLVLETSEEALREATQRLTPRQIEHVKDVATKVWSPGLARDAEYKGQCVEIWEIGQSQTVKVRTKISGSFIKVRRKDLRPWLGI